MSVWVVERWRGGGLYLYLLALCGCGRGAGGEIVHDGGVCPWTELCSACHPGCEVAFETQLVVVAGSMPIDVLTCGFVHDSVLEEDG